MSPGALGDPPFALCVGDRLRVAGTPVAWDGPGAMDALDRGVRRGGPLELTASVEVGDRVLTVRCSLRNLGDRVLIVDTLLPVVVDLDGTVAGIDTFTSSWGLEFEPEQLEPGEAHHLHVDSGRSSHGRWPWLSCAMTTGTGERTVLVAPHWSGNWEMAVEPRGSQDSAETVWSVAVGLHPPEAEVGLEPGQDLDLPACTVAWGSDRTTATHALVTSTLSRAPRTAPLLTEWNHWWPYEDTGISEQVFLDNAEVAAELGLDVAVLDAGWFGAPAADSDWQQQRGDWHRVNTTRFPGGLTWLAEQTRARGIGFGIWIEAEAVGELAHVLRDRPELMATRRSGGGEPESLGYVCLGSPAGREHVAATVADLVEGTGAAWVKWDFNLNPGLGCDRDDHGHRAGEGLLRHYWGLYAVLDDLRRRFPETVLEACSSGGLRIDAGLAEHVDGFFLSDPDWTEHHLTCLWGASHLLPPRQILHWPQSEWRSDHRFQKIDYSGSLLTLEQFDASIQAAMLHRFGLSIRLTAIRPDLRARLAHHVNVWKTRVRPLLTDGILVPLNGQPLREERGNRQPAFQLSSADRHVVAAFRLPPTGSWLPVVPRDVSADATYEVSVLDPGGGTRVVAGRDLLGAGVPLPAPARRSTLVTLDRCG